MNDTCSGFFQLGFDFNKNDHIAPWYVNGTLAGDCEAHYFHGFGGESISSGQRSDSFNRLEIGESADLFQDRCRDYRAHFFDLNSVH